MPVRWSTSSPSTTKEASRRLRPAITSRSQHLATKLLGSKLSYHALRVSLVVLALVAAYMVYKVGDLGAKAVWEGRLQAAAGHAFPGGPPGGGYPAP